MDENTIQEIADAIHREIAKSLGSTEANTMADGSWVSWAVLFMTGILAISGIFVTAYLKKRGEQFASKSDLEILVAQASRTAEAVEEAKALVERRTGSEEIRLKYNLIQDPVLQECNRIIVRFRELFRGQFAADYQRKWDPASISLVELESSKRDTCVYRFFRLLSQSYIYYHHASGLPYHYSYGFFNFYVERKIIPALASGHLPGDYVLWRDAALEIGEIMSEYSEKWKSIRPLNWFDFVSAIKFENSQGQFMNYYASRISNFIEKSNLRLAILSIYLIDIVQDNRNYKPWESFRNDLLKFIANSGQYNFSLYGKVDDGKKNDIEAMNIETGLVPCNHRAPRFNPEKNLGYQLPKSNSELAIEP